MKALRNKSVQNTNASWDHRVRGVIQQDFSEKPQCVGERKFFCGYSCYAVAALSLRLQSSAFCFT